MSYTMNNIVSITEVSRNFPKVLQKLPQAGYLIVMKNYKPVAKISTTQGAIDDDEGIFMLREIREKAWGKNSNLMQDAFERLENLPKKELPLLLRGMV